MVQVEGVWGGERAEALEGSGRARLPRGGPGTFDGDAFAGPLLLKGGEALLLPDADDVLLEVKLFGVEAQQSEPQLPHRLRVRLQLRQDPVLPTHKQLRAAWTPAPERAQPRSSAALSTHTSPASSDMPV